MEMIVMNHGGQGDLTYKLKKYSFSEIQNLENEWLSQSQKPSINFNAIEIKIKCDESCIEKNFWPEDKIKTVKIIGKGIKEGIIEFFMPTPSHLPIKVRIINDGLKILYLSCFFQVIYSRKFF